MASGILDADKISKEKGGGNKVYTRRPKKGIKTTVSTTTAAAAAVVPPAVSVATTVVSPPVTSAAAAVSPIAVENNDQTLTLASDDSASQNLQRHESIPEEEEEEAAVVVRTGNGISRPIVTFVNDRVKIYLEASTPKDEINELKEKLTAELNQVRSLVERLEDKEAEITNNNNSNSALLVGPTTGIIDEPYSHSLYPDNNNRRSLLRVNSEMNTDYMDHRRALSRVHSDDRRILTRVGSEVGSLSNHDARFRHLNVSVVDNINNNNSNGLGIGMVGEFVEKEKRTPKANQYYRNSDFLLGKDRLPPESNKRLKPNGGGRKSEYNIGLERQKNQAFRSCSNLLQRLMKHKHGWVFNEPVNAKLLGLHDYHDIIKHPMDLGTIKSRLAQSFYKIPGEFADDVRLTFRNAMTYNPKGQDVHVMAEQLSNVFEERWAVIESEYNNRDWRYSAVHDSVTPRKVNHFAPASTLRTFDRPEAITLPAYVSRITPTSRTPVPSKPKAKDPNKRNMTYEEKQKLSANLQSLPSEKLDNIVQIIKKSNTSLSQHDDEIEVDIDSVDVETLWELDRFVTNYKKSLSKHRRKAELAQQARALAENGGDQTMLQNPVTTVPEALTEKRAAEKSLATIPANQGGDNVSRSSSSSSSSSDSGSSSSDSDSSSSSGSEAGNSPRS